MRSADDIGTVTSLVVTDCGNEDSSDSIGADIRPVDTTDNDVAVLVAARNTASVTHRYNNRNSVCACCN